MSEAPIRPVRSYVRRQGRMTPAQLKGLRLAEQYGLRADEVNGYVCASEQPVVLEIGFGMGEALFAVAKAMPHVRFIGLEVHQPGVGALLNRIEAEQLDNLKVCSEDATEVLATLPEQSLSKVQIYFPDPWPKKKHHKRRIIQPDFVQLIVSRLKDGGVLHLATDWQDYYEHMCVVLKDSKLDPAPEATALSHSQNRPKTRFEQRGIRLGHAIHDLVWVKPEI